MEDNYFYNEYPDSDKYAKRQRNRHRFKRNKDIGNASGKSENQTASVDGEELTTYSPNEAKEYGSVGVLAEIEYYTYFIISGGKLISGVAESKEQKSMLGKLAIGDYVVFNASGQNIEILGIVERHSKLVRISIDATKTSIAKAEEHIIAANIDIAVIVASTTKPPFRTGLIDRYLIMCQYGNISPLLCITKTDLAPMPDLSIYKDSGFPIIGVSNKTHEGIENLVSHLKGNTCVLVGNSGVGKSTLINTLLKKEIMPTNEVSSKSGKGRHTTTSTSLHLMDESTSLIDTPGIRSLELWNIDSGSLRLYFTEFTKFAADCEFRDCTHSHEPHCAVKEAVKDGLISKERYDSYLRLLKKAK